MDFLQILVNIILFRFKNTSAFWSLRDRDAWAKRESLERFVSNFNEHYFNVSKNTSEFCSFREHDAWNKISTATLSWVFKYVLATSFLSSVIKVPQ